MKRIIPLLFLLFAISASCQSAKKATYKSIRPQLIEFLIEKKEIKEKEIDEFRNGDYGLHFLGIFNEKDYRKGDLPDGMYFFSLSKTHVNSYFLILELDKVTILDISNRGGLDISIRNVLDFCEQKKYCSDITHDYVGRLINSYYKINKNPINRFDPNCKEDVDYTKKLP